jgi:outer membrane lipoprotein-sorting protein
MKRILLFIALAFCILPPADGRAQAGTDRERILQVADRIEAAYGRLQSYACDIEGIYFDEGREYERYVFRFYFRKPGRFRIEFQSPYAGVTIFYTEGEKEFVSRPLALFPSVQFRFSVDNPLFKSPSGQGVHQMHLLYFLDFLRKNAKSLPQQGADFRQDGQVLSFWLSARDYLAGGMPERYRMHINTGLWLPERFERYNQAGTPLEFTYFRNYRVNPALDGAFFESGYRESSSIPPSEPVRP